MMFTAHRIAFLIHSLSGGGVSNVCVKLANELASRGIFIDLIVLNKLPHNETVSENIRLIHLESWKGCTMIFKLARYLKHEQPAVLISSTITGILISLIVRKFIIPKLKLVIRIDGHYSSLYKALSLQTSVQMYMIKRFLSVPDTVDIIICVSVSVADDMKKWIPQAANLVTYVPNPVVNSTLFEMSKVPVEHPWFNDPKIPIIISVGRLHIREKNQPILFRAFSEIIKERNARLVVIGDGPDIEKLLALSKDLKILEHTHFFGFQDNPLRYIAKAQVFVQTSLFEGLPTVIIEALACGTPIIATDCPGGTREILEDGKWGTLIPVDDWKALVREIHEVLDHHEGPRQPIQRIWEYSVTASADQFLRILNRVMFSDNPDF